ncbi:MAG: LysM peptidoglycan-binding domain-containing protein [Oligoflexales bacterium]|nr:LysM peptidoglycan-binding domain-containing protein [Oligoflexales bacterium]
MRTTSMSNVFWVLLGVFVLSFNLSSCADDEDQQQEQLEEDGEEDSSEYGEEYVEEVDDTAGIETGEPMELGSPVSEDAGIGMGLAVGEDTSMPEPVGNSLEEVAEDQTAQLGGDSYDSESFKYTIVKGDWLSKIAQRVYGDMYKWPLIANANSYIKNPNLIYPNDVISVPIIDEQSREFSRTYAQVDLNKAEIEEKFVSIKIKKGESLSKIAKKVFGSVDAWKTIWQANQANIPNPDMVVVGQVIKVPVSADMTDIAQFAQL